MFVDECIHGIFPEQSCSICNGSDKKRADDESAEDSVKFTFTAKFSGVCRSCGDIIEAGDTISRLNNGKIVCEDCAEQTRSSS